MSYSYTLPAYNENGDKKDITFGTSRELKEGAFIRLTVMPIRGVLEWSEVQYDTRFAIPVYDDAGGLVSLRTKFRIFSK